MATIEVKSDVAGRVWRIDAAPGSTLAEDDAIVTLECMKMEIPVLAPRAGRLAELLVAEGDEVAEDQLIARLEE